MSNVFWAHLEHPCLEPKYRMQNFPLFYNICRIFIGLDDQGQSRQATQLYICI